MSPRDCARSIVSGTDPRWGRTFDYAIMALIALSTVTIALETLPGLPASLRTALRIEEMIVIGVFTLEYALRLWVAEHPGRYVFSFWGLIDLAAVLPFYLSLGMDLRGLRVLRVLRLIRILKLLRYMKAMNRLHRAFQAIRDELLIFGLLSGIVLYLAAVGIYHFENVAQPDAFSSIPQSLWWALATLTTVGYGDVYPITIGGRVFTFLVLLVGLGVVAVPSGLIASALTNMRAREPQRPETEKGADPAASAPDGDTNDGTDDPS